MVRAKEESSRAQSRPPPTFCNEGVCNFSAANQGYGGVRIASRIRFPAPDTFCSSTASGSSLLEPPSAMSSGRVSAFLQEMLAELGRASTTESNPELLSRGDKLSSL